MITRIDKRVAMVALGIGTGITTGIATRAFISIPLLWVARHCGITMHYNALK